jgi:hypothetical protein
MELCDALGLDYVLGMLGNSRLQKHVQTVEASATERYARMRQKLCCFKTFFYAALSWSKPRCVIAGVEVCAWVRALCSKARANHRRPRFIYGDYPLW